jgi:hypothetical protein
MQVPIHCMAINGDLNLSICPYNKTGLFANVVISAWKIDLRLMRQDGTPV